MDRRRQGDLRGHLEISGTRSNFYLARFLAGGRGGVGVLFFSDTGNVFLQPLLRQFAPYGHLKNLLLNFSGKINKYYL